MADIVADFLLINALSVPPDTLGELIPYLLQILIACFSVSVTFGLIGKIVDVMMSFRRW